MGAMITLGMYGGGGGGEVMESRCMCSPKSSLRPPPEDEVEATFTGETSSNLSSMTVLVSMGSATDRPISDPGRPDPPRRLLNDEERPPVAYSGKSRKLSGVTTTPNVPGLCTTAFLSRSSSEVSTEKSGK